MGVPDQKSVMELFQEVDRDYSRVLDTCTGPVGVGSPFGRRASVRRHPFGGTHATGAVRPDSTLHGVQRRSGTSRFPISRNQIICHVFDEESFSLFPCKQPHRIAKRLMRRMNSTAINRERMKVKTSGLREVWTSRI